VSRRGWLLFTVMCLVWGIPYLLIKIAVQGVPVSVLVFARTAGGAIVLLPLAVRAGGWSALRRHWVPLTAFAVAEVIGPWWLLSDAERRLPSSLTGLLIAAVPIVGVVLARLTGDTERLGAVRWGGLVVGLAGVMLLALPDLGGGNGLAMLEMMLVVLGYATAPLIAARGLATMPNLPMTVACLGLAAVVYAPPAVVSWPRELPSGPVLAALVGLALICTAVAFLAYFALIREVGPSRAMVFTYVNPAVAVAAGVTLLDEPLTGLMLCAFVLILGGCVLATLRQRHRRPQHV